MLHTAVSIPTLCSRISLEIRRNDPGLACPTLLDEFFEMEVVEYAERVRQVMV
jgi:hypothetical protein